MDHLWSWGSNSHGQLGLNIVSEQEEKPSRVVVELFGNKIKQISCGGSHSLLLDNEGKLFSCGSNFKKQLGCKHDSHTFERVWGLSGIKFTHISCGWDFSCAVTDDKFLFVWGSNTYGQLGLPKEHFTECVKPIRLQVNVYAISMGLRHTALINSKGEVWVTGCGKHGQLGLGDNILSIDRFTKILQIGMISHIACGQRHTVAWSSDENALYVWGDNKHGQLLLGFLDKKYDKIFTPQKIDIDVKQKVKSLFSGWSNNLLWLMDGTILTWGKNNLGQLGTEGPYGGKIIVVKLPECKTVKDIAVGSEHTICLASDGTLWAWGWNEHANTGITADKRDQIFVPSLVPIEINNKEIITQIYAGGAHNFIITQQSHEHESDVSKLNFNDS